MKMKEDKYNKLKKKERNKVGEGRRKGRKGKGAI